MRSSPARVFLYRFGAYELDEGAVSLRKDGTRLRLQRKPFQALQALLQRPGVLVTRDELRDRLWEGDTFVEFDDSLNHAVNRIRAALNDSPDSPRYVETIPGEGYRFIATVERVEVDVSAPEVAAAPAEAPSSSQVWRWLALAGVVILASGALFKLWDGSTAAGKQFTKPVVAVLPLADLSEDPELAHFAPSMTDELIARLAKIGGLQVISRTSSERAAADGRGMLPEIASRLGATHIVEGSVTIADGQVRVTAQLIEAATDRHTWSGTYTKTLDDIIAIQNQLAREIARGIDVELTPGEAARLATATTVSPEVYSAYSKARSLFEGGHMAEAIEAFQRVIELDPDFAPAHSWLADSYIVFGWWRGPPRDIMPKAKLVAQRALELDETRADAHLLMAKVQAFFEWEWEAAEQHYRQAIETNPSYAKAYLGYGIYLAVQRRNDEAIEMARQAVELDPVSASTLGAAADIYYMTDHRDEAISHYRSAAELQPEGAMWRAMLGCAYTDAGAFDQAHAALESSLAFAGDDARPKAILAWSYARSGKMQAARKLLSELDQLAGSENATHYFRAMGYLATGDRNRTFELLEQAVKERWGFVGTVTVIPAFKPIRQDPRFVELLSSIGLDHE